MPKVHPNSYVVDVVSQRDIRLSKQRYDSVSRYYWDHYCYFAQQRLLIFDALKNALAKNCQSFTFSQWQRVVDYKFSLDPLSAKGSVLNDPGGRFNIGDIDQSKFPAFAALYIAAERETAYKEKFGLYRVNESSGLSSDELALTAHDAITMLVLKGEIGQVLNLTTTDSLEEFYQLIKSIDLPNKFIRRARELNLESPMFPVESIAQLSQTILSPNWRDIPMQVDIPANSQILGQIAFAAGVEGILYPSKITNQNCLAIFPKNFEQSTSYVELDGAIPKEVTNFRLDCQNYLLFI